MRRWRFDIEQVIRICIPMYHRQVYQIPTYSHLRRCANADRKLRFVKYQPIHLNIETNILKLF